MWYGANGANNTTPGVKDIGYATSVDGKIWSKHFEPVLGIGGLDDWDNSIIAPHTVIKEDSLYKMWFWGGNGWGPTAEQFMQIGMATSTDGINWVKYDDPSTTASPFANSDPVLKRGAAGEWDDRWVNMPMVLPTETGYEMWYGGTKLSTNNPWWLGYATSTDGILWTKSGTNPILANPTWGTWQGGGTVLKFDEEYHLWYYCFHTTAQATPRIGYATSLIDPIIPIVEVYASGLTKPMGITTDGAGNLWVGEQGTGNDNSQISIVTTNKQVHPFLTGLPSETHHGDIIGAEHVYFDIDGKLLIVQGEGSDPLSESILVVDPSGFTPGDPPLSTGDIEAVYNIGDFAIAQGAQSTNPIRITLGPNDDWYISDAGFNGVIKRERSSGILSVFTQGVAVSTGIVFTGDKFYLGSLTGFPFPTGGAKIYEVDLSGNATVYQDGLTAIMDVAINPIDSSLFALQYGEFSGGGFQSNSGALFKINNGTVDTLFYGLNFPAGMAFNSTGDLFITSFADGEVLKVTGIITDVNDENDVDDENNYKPDNFVLYQNYPNPFNPSTKIKYSIPQSSNVVIKVFDILGNAIATLVNEEKSIGNYEVQFDATGLSSGVYFYTLTAGNFVENRKMLLMK